MSWPKKPSQTSSRVTDTSDRGRAPMPAEWLAQRSKPRLSTEKPLPPKVPPGAFAHPGGGAPAVRAGAGRHADGEQGGAAEDTAQEHHGHDVEDLLADRVGAAGQPPHAV